MQNVQDKFVKKKKKKLYHLKTKWEFREREVNCLIDYRIRWKEHKCTQMHLPKFLSFNLPLKQDIFRLWVLMCLGWRRE